jgi:5-deoxy-D-glucuronate isomerase
VKPRTLPGIGQRAGIIDYQPQYALFVLDGGAIECSDRDGALRVNAVLAPGVWTTVACTITTTQIEVWVDGVPRASKAVTDFRLGATDTSGVAVAGNVPTPQVPAPEPLDGWLDDLRVWRRVLAPADLCRSAPGCQ